MTIYKGTAADEKKLVKKSDVVIATDVFVPLTQAEAGKIEESLQSYGIKVLRNNAQDCERRFMRICVIAAILTVFAFAACLGYFARQRLCNYKPFVETVHVQFHEYRRHNDDQDKPESRIEGGFYEQVEIDWKTKRYEKLNIPPFIDVKRATVVHDFLYMWTAIVDLDNSHCFIVPLNITITYPPDQFLEYVYKIRSGRNLPNPKMERQVYKVVTPQTDNLMEFGDIIATECLYYDTYRLVKAEEPVAMSKRFACRFSGETYCLGGTGYPFMVLIVLEGCV